MPASRAAFSWAHGDGTELGSQGHSWEVAISDIPVAGRTGVGILDICYSLGSSEPLQVRKQRCRGAGVLYLVCGGRWLSWDSGDPSRIGRWMKQLSCERYYGDGGDRER